MIMVGDTADEIIHLGRMNAKVLMTTMAYHGVLLSV